MSRAFWVAVGAVGGIFAYRRSTQAAARARELGPLGTAQATAEATSRLAGSTANGLSKISNIRDRRSGRLVIGTAEAVDAQTGPGGTALPGSQTTPIPEGWVPVSPKVVVPAEDEPPLDADPEATTPRPPTTAGSNPRVRRARHD